jgi:uncharacterized protein YcbK (DUF882 family)
LQVIKDKLLSKSFRSREMRCRCSSPSCDAAAMRPSFMAKLQQLRDEWGKPLIVTSAARCKAHNARVGGSPNSQHVLGNAADLYVTSEYEAGHLAALAEKLGFHGIGVSDSFVHVDLGPEGRRWTY